MKDAIIQAQVMIDYLQVAAFQGCINEYDHRANLAKIISITSMAEGKGIDLLTFPEVYLHGYYSNKADAVKNAINLQSEEFADICASLSQFHHTTVLLGLNELENDLIYNTVVVIEKGQCIGKYRKAYTYAPYDYYSLGRDFPVFDKKGVKYGIIICIDSNYREPAHIAALKGARILFCPSFNRVAKDAPVLSRMNSKNHFISRAYDNHCWFVTSDIIWDDEHEVCQGYTCILNDEGEVVANAKPFQEMLISYSIPMASLNQRKTNRLFGNHELFEIVKSTYESACMENRTMSKSDIKIASQDAKQPDLEFRRKTDGAVYRYHPCDPLDGHLAWKREDKDLWVTRKDDYGWVCIDANNVIHAIPWPTSSNKISALPPASEWISMKLDKSYIYDLVYI